MSTSIIELAGHQVIQAGGHFRCVKCGYDVCGFAQTGKYSCACTQKEESA